MKIITDLSSVLGAYLHIKDEEFGLDKVYKGKKFHLPYWETSLDTFKSTVLNLGIPLTDFIIVKDPTGPCKRRGVMYKGYKQKPRVAPPEFFDIRSKLFEEATLWLKSLGAIVATPKTDAEADDLIIELTKRLPETMVWTRDKDLLCVDVDVMFQDNKGIHINPVKFPVPRKYITVYRAIVLGDNSDNVKSCKGFGPKAWTDMVEQFGDEVYEDLKTILEEHRPEVLNDHIATFPKFQLLHDQFSAVWLAYKVMQPLPVHAHEIKWEGGMLNGDSTLVTNKNFERVKRTVEGLSFDYSVIDFESDVGQESRAWSAKSGVKVDVMGQEICGMGLRIHDQNWYFCVDHADTDNITIDQLESILELLWGKTVYAHNASFENTLIYNHFGVLMPNIVDTMLMANYVDENDYTNLKHQAKKWLGYQQTSYADTIGDKSGMREITGLEVVEYGIDDVIVTDSIMNLFTAIMQYEGTLEVFNQVENDALYFTTLAFVKGVEFDQEAYDELNRTNAIETRETWDKLNDMMLDLDWEGGEFREVKSLSMGELNRVHKAIHGEEIPDVTAAKVAIRMMDDRALADMAADRDFDKINEYYRRHWKPTVEFNVKSPKQMTKLLYDVLGCPKRIINKPTANMVKAGKPGNPAANELAIQNAIAYKDTDQVELLETLLKYKGLLTKRSLFLDKYPPYVHWKTGRIHASLRQSSTTTRRFTCSSPNLQQLPKRAGKEYRNMLKARKGYTMVALDFTGQELRLAADDSKDPDFLACYIGDDPKDPHSLTGLRIANNSGKNMDYDTFFLKNEMGVPEVIEFRTIGKKINFTAQYGAMAPKVAHTLCISEGEAQKYLDSRAAAFPVLMERVKEWHKICREKKYATTMLGGRRHLDDRLFYGSRDDYQKMAADRLAYSMRIQGSAAEMTKLVTGYMYKQGIFEDDIVIPVTLVHDEVVLEVRTEMVDELMPTLIDLVCSKYADMIVPMETEPETGSNFGSLKRWTPPELRGDE